MIITMKNTLENKAKLFAQYWGQPILSLDMNNNYPNQKPWFDFVYDENYNSPSFLQLKPLSSITDEGLLEVAKIVGYRNIITDMRKKRELIRLTKSAISSHVLVYKVVDYLRSKGYALPFMGLSVEKQIEYGWIKLK